MEHNLTATELSQSKSIYDYLADEILYDELLIDTSSAANFELELANFAQKQYHFHRLYVAAVKAEREANLKVEMTVATIVDEMYKNDPSLPQSARSELRRTKALLDPRYKEVKQEWIDKAATSDILKGITSAFRTKGFKLKEIESLVKDQLYDKRLPNSKPLDLDNRPKRRTNTQVRSLLDDAGENMIVS